MMPNFELTINERDLLLGLIRTHIRKVNRGKITLQKKFKDNFDSNETDVKLAFLINLYRNLGGNPDNITNVKS
jgi:hypothetical protein